MNPTTYQAEMTKAMAALAVEAGKVLLDVARRLDVTAVGAFENACAEFSATAERLNKQLSVDGRSTSWTPERRAAHGKRVSEAKASNRPKLYLFSWAGEEPAEFEYTAAAAVMGISEGSLRVKISTEGGAVVFYAENRHQVFSRSPDPAFVNEALMREYHKTGNHDDMKTLSKRAKLRR